LRKQVSPSSSANGQQQQQQQQQPSSNTQNSAYLHSSNSNGSTTTGSNVEDTTSLMMPTSAPAVTPVSQHQLPSATVSTYPTYPSSMMHPHQHQVVDYNYAPVSSTTSPSAALMPGEMSSISPNYPNDHVRTIRKTSIEKNDC